MNEKQNSLRNLFNEAVEITDAAERTAFLQRACGNDASLRQRLDRLLKAHADAGGFLGERGGAIITEKPGDRIGRYKLLEQIGEGGCGIVYMAEQEEPVRRRVAVKVIKLGMDTKSVIARFEAERQALALMDHPNIARVLDAGATDAGRPYFVMELVKGVRITEYCDQNNLSTTARLDLFTQVCHAIQHAHQKGIIHRDIKPSNILVILHDGVPVPKVIDFGIAKATDRRLTDKTLFTAFEQLMGTPAYMSPEQAEMSGLDIDTRSDIYALGVLLYELLTGQPPFDGRELLASGLDAMRRTIREVEPLKPSTRLTQESSATPSVGSTKSEIRNPKSTIDKDLDWIVMKALEKDRTRRYDTVNGLAMDIARHLNNEPVVARPPTHLYRFQKLVRRNKLAFSVTSAVLAALILGLGISTWMFFKEKHARQRAVAAEKNAKTEASKSQQVAQFLKDMLKGVGPSVALGRDTTMLREILDKTVERIGKDLMNQPEVEVELRSTIGTVYFDLGQFDKAESMHRRSLESMRKLWGNEDPALAPTLHSFAEVLRRQNKLEEAEMTERQALAIDQKRFGNEHPTVGASLNNLALVLKDQGKLEEAAAMFREALAMNQMVLGNEHPQVGISLLRWGTVLEEQGKLTEAEPMYRNAVAIHRKALDKKYAETDPPVGIDPHLGLAWSLHCLASVLHRQAKLPEAETVQREALTTLRLLLGDKHPDVGSFRNKLGIVLRDQGKFADAEALQRETLSLLKQLVQMNPNDAFCRQEEAYTSWMLAKLLERIGRLDAAAAEYRQTITLHEKAIADFPGQAWFKSRLVLICVDLVSMLNHQGNRIEAKAVIHEALELERKRLPADEAALAGMLATFTVSLLAEKQFAEAEPLARECLAIREKRLPDDWRTFNTQSMLGSSLLGLKKYAEAEPLLLSGYKGVRQREDKIPANDKLPLQQTLQRTVQLYEESGQPDKAAEWKNKLADFDKAEIEKKAAAPKPSPLR